MLRQAQPPMQAPQLLQSPPGQMLGRQQQQLQPQPAQAPQLQVTSPPKTLFSVLFNVPLLSVTQTSSHLSQQAQ